MTITLKRQLTDAEKKRVLVRFGRVCFATGHEIPDEDTVHFDHIRAFSEGGATELNIAPMCETHNKQKGTLALEDFRTKLQLEDFFQKGDSLTLRDLLLYQKSRGDIKDFGRRVAVTENGGVLSVEAPDYRASHSLYTCPTTGWK